MCATETNQDELDQQEFMAAAAAVHETTQDMTSDLTFIACASVMLDVLDDLLSSPEYNTYGVMLANQVHVEFINLMANHGFDLASETKH
jgi:hypothetical protein